MTSPQPAHRRGPRPLLLHLGLAMLRTNTLPAGISPAEWRNLKPDSPPWSAILDQVRTMLAQLGQHPNAAPDILAAQIGGSLTQNHDLIAGIAAYRRHSWQRDLADPPACWQEGASRLLDYAPPNVPRDAPPDAPTVLFVPSLVNRATVLDLTAAQSMLRFLAGHGVRPLLLDWGWPGTLERGFALADYITGRLHRALEAACVLAGGPVVLAGYCMGGTLAVAAAQRQPQHLRGLALLATPWDFHAGDPARARQLAALLAGLEPMLSLTGTLPVDALQTLFTLLDPWGVGTKYRAFAQLEPESERARLFVALEDWLNDGVPLAAPVARECLAQWYGANQPANGEWDIAGMVVDPRAIRHPSFVAVPARDRIVPPESARPLAALIPGAVLHEPAAGHIGMVAGRTAEAVLWRPFLDWLRRL